ncbi:MAG: DUF350 domain-containing protein [Azonexaceae bacterium]|nr:DUF350 domain-containing protein [Azonexaceae bacterium]
MFDPVLNQLPAFAGFFATAIVLLVLFVLLYVWVTPYNELALIREGNTAAAISLGGALLGYALPIGVSVATSHDIAVMVGWGVVAGAVQLGAYLVARLALPDLGVAIPHERRSAGIFMASLSVGVGILNAACIV